MARPSKQSIKTASKKIANNAKVLTRNGLDKGYELKRPIARALLADLRLLNPTAKPAEIQELLDADLVKAEKKHGIASGKFSAAATLYVVASVELRDVDIKSISGHQKLVDLMVLFDSKGVRFVRRALAIAAFVAPFLKGARVIKILAGAAAVTPMVNKASKRIQGKYSIAEFLAKKTGETLGPAPTGWSSEITAGKPSKRRTKRILK